MSAILKTAAAFVVGAATLVTASSAAAPASASAAAMTIPVRVVPGMPKTVEACNPGGFTVTTAPHLGTAITNDAGFVYTTNAGVAAGDDTLVGHCNSAAGTTLTFRLTIAGKNPNPVRVSFTEACQGSAGSVEFTMVNTDSRRHSVDIASPALSPHRDAGNVPAASTVSVSFGIGAGPAKVSVRVNGGRPGFVELKGCPAGNGASGVVPVRGGKTGDGFLARHPYPKNDQPQDAHAVGTVHAVHGPRARPRPQAR
jgi:hypothetical protein